jgi:hypothetical protein
MKMKRFQLLGVALVAVFAFGALVVASASALPTFLLAEWLVGGNPITAELHVDIVGELLLEDEKALGLIKAKVLCSGLLEGSMGLTGEDLITKLFDLLGNEINKTALTEAGLVCENQENCPEPLVWAINLPWNTLLELMEENNEVFFADLISSGGGGNPGWYVWCMGTNTVDTCEAAEGVTKITAEAPNLDGMFEEAFTELAGLKLALCTLPNAETGVVEGLGTISLVETGTLTASE